MNRNIKLSEMIKELQMCLEKNGDCEINSIGTSSGSNSSFIFRTKNIEQEDANDIYIKCISK